MSIGAPLQAAARAFNPSARQERDVEVGGGAMLRWAGGEGRGATLRWEEGTMLRVRLFFLSKMENVTFYIFVHCGDLFQIENDHGQFVAAD